MNEQEQIVARLLARRRGRAVPSRDVAMLAPDPEPTVGIASIKIVTEDMIQALAFGRLDRHPNLVARMDPLSREATDLEPFAEWLIERVRDTLAAERLLRVWVPHRGTLDALDVLGHRYATNREASAALQAMGKICRLLAEEAHYEGQQVVVPALQLLQEHFVSGQAPSEDAHLGAFLAWLRPEPGRAPSAVAYERSLRPASGILVNTPDQRDDDAVEGLRQLRKRGDSAERLEAERRLGEILEAAVLREWALLLEARNAFWSAGLRREALDALVRESVDRLRRPVETVLAGEDYHAPRHPHALASLLERHENASSGKRREAERLDERVRAAETRRGRVLIGEVVRVDQPQRRRRPCHVTIRSTQPVLRLREEQRVTDVGHRFRGVVRAFQRDEEGCRLVAIEIVEGVSKPGLTPGTCMEWCEDSSFPPYLRLRAYARAGEMGAWIGYGDRIPEPRPALPRDRDPLELAEEVYKRK